MKTEKTRKITIPYSGFIPLIRRSGPVMQPITLSDSTCFKLVCKGFNVYENGRKLKVTDFISGNNPSATLNEKTKVTPKMAADTAKVPAKKKEDTTLVYKNDKNPETKVVYKETKVTEDNPKEDIVEEEKTSNESNIGISATVIDGSERKLSKKERKKLERLARENASNNTVEEKTEGSSEDSTEIEETIVTEEISSEEK